MTKTEARGLVTIPTDANYVEKTKDFMKYWGADAIRDCDGVSLPKDLKQFNCDVYKAYFIVREDHEFALSHSEFWQNTALVSDRYTAMENTLEIDLLKNTFKESFAVNTERYKEFWQVIDRTSGKIVTDWEYLGNNVVGINNCEKYHEYTVNFFAKSCWDPVQIYNYHVNNWSCPKDIDLDPVYPEALSHMLLRMEKWLKDNPDVTVVRFTTFFYNFFIVNVTGTKQRIWDWHNYAMTASPAMFDLFEKEAGEKIFLEDIISGGYYSNKFVIPTVVMRKYVDFVQKKCAVWAKLFVDLCHKYGKKAMMFDGDHRIGVEPYSPYFKEIGLDAVVGAPNSSVYVRQIADMTGVKCKEGRLNPYFFPNECPGDDKGTEILAECWDGMRKGLLVKPIDRIGFGGYLKQIEHYEKFKSKVKEVCDEFRTIKSNIGNGECMMKSRIAVLTYWGRMDSWMMNGMSVGDSRQDGYFYNCFIYALSVLPIKVDFISFDEIKTKNLADYDVIISDGLPGTSFHGDYLWKDSELVVKLREYVYNGGGFVGIGEPSGYQYQGRYFQLSDVLGMEKECNFTHFELRDNVVINTEHWITKDINLSKLHFNEKIQGVYPLTAQLIVAHFNAEYPYGSLDACNADFAVNEYGKGRSVYLSGIGSGVESTRFVYNVVLWAGRNEDKKYRIYAENPCIDAFYYEESRKYALINSSDKEEKTLFYDKNGEKSEYILNPKEIRWINGNIKAKIR